MKNWGVIGGIAAALAAGIYVIWGPITERKKRRKGKNEVQHCGLWTFGDWVVGPLICKAGTAVCEVELYAAPPRTLWWEDSRFFLAPSCR